MATLWIPLPRTPPYTVRGNSIEVTVPAEIKNMALGVGGFATLSVSNPDAGMKYTWNSTNDDVATAVDNGNGNGKATICALTEGTTMIRVSATPANAHSNETIYSEFYVTVQGKAVVDSGTYFYQRANGLEDGKQYVIATGNTEGFTTGVEIDNNGTFKTMNPYVAIYNSVNPYLMMDDPLNNAAQNAVWTFSDPDKNGYGTLLNENGMYLTFASEIWTQGAYQAGAAAVSGGDIAHATYQWTYVEGVNGGSGLISKQMTDGDKIQLAHYDGYNKDENKDHDEWIVTRASKFNGNLFLEVHIYERTPLTYTLQLSDKVGEVAVGGTETGSMIVKTWATGQVEYIPVTVDMLPVDSSAAGTYTNISVTYEGTQICADYTLIVGGGNTITVPAGYYYRLTDQFVEGVDFDDEKNYQYLILDRNDKGEGVMMEADGFSDHGVKATTVLVSLDANGVPSVQSQYVKNPTYQEWWKHQHEGAWYLWQPNFTGAGNGNNNFLRINVAPYYNVLTGSNDGHAMKGPDMGKSGSYNSSTCSNYTTVRGTVNAFGKTMYVHLENSIGEDGIGVPAGIYETNTYADLHYTNANNNHCTLHTVSPTLPWQTAVVNYMFYLVDEEGNVIVDDVTGEIGGFANRIPVTKPVTVDMNKNVDGSLDDVITASSVLPDGYKLYDSNASYSIHSNSGNNTGGGWVIGGTSGTTYVTGYGGDPSNVAVKTSNTGSYNNTTVWFAVTYTIGGQPDTVVIDYGIPVDIDVLGNDMFPNSVEISGIFKGKNSTLTNGVGHLIQTANDPKYQAEAGGVFGTAKLISGESGQKIRYTLNLTNGMEMNKEEVFSYVVPYEYIRMANGIKTVEKRNYYSTVTVIPATTIYYEDGFVTFKSFQMSNDQEITSQWTDAGNADNALQGQDRPGFGLADIDADNIYGYDSAYTAYTNYSLGSAKKVTVNNNTYGTAEFSFWGTGFDVISLTGNNTGTIVVSIYKKSDNSMVKSLMVDTYYGYTYVDGKWVVDKTAQGELYQVPVMKVANLPYGNYKAVITVSYAPFFDHQNTDGKNQYDFYLDAIRIYDPANDGTSSDVIEDAYVKDNEGWPSYQELRNMVISEGTFDSLGKNDAISGIVFIDNTLDSNKNRVNSVSDYRNFGPNNELYLAPGQAISFDLDGGNNVAAIHLAMKSVGGSDKQANLTMYSVNGGKKENERTLVIATATDLYYDITAMNGKTVVISNESSSDVVLSITNIKTTYTANPNGTAQSNVFMLRRSNVDAVLMLMNAAQDQENSGNTDVPGGNENTGNTGNSGETTSTEPSSEPTEPKQTEPEQTEPMQTQPEQTQPEQTQPEQTEPEQTEPSVPAEGDEDQESTGTDPVMLALMIAIILPVTAALLLGAFLLTRKRKGEE